MAKLPEEEKQVLKKRINRIRWFSIPITAIPFIQLVIATSADIVQILSSTTGQISIGLLIVVIIGNIALYWYIRQLKTLPADSDLSSTGKARKLSRREEMRELTAYRHLTYLLAFVFAILIGITAVLARHIYSFERVMAEYATETKIKEDIGGYSISMPFSPVPGSTIQAWINYDDYDLGNIAEEEGFVARIVVDEDNPHNKAVRAEADLKAQGLFGIQTPLFPGKSYIVQNRLRIIKSLKDLPEEVQELADGKWHTITHIIKGNTAEIWVDGQYKRSEKVTVFPMINRASTKIISGAVVLYDDLLIWTNP